MSTLLHRVEDLVTELNGKKEDVDREIELVAKLVNALGELPPETLVVLDGLVPPGPLPLPNKEERWVAPVPSDMALPEKAPKIPCSLGCGVMLDPYRAPTLHDRVHHPEAAKRRTP